MKQEGEFTGFLRAAALTATVAGAVASVVLTLHAGRRNRSLLLPTLFALWVLSPFAAILWAEVISKRWAPSVRTTLYCATVAAVAASVAIYGYVVFGPPRAKIASFFLVVPPVSCLLIAIVLAIAAMISRGRLRRQ